MAELLSKLPATSIGRASIMLCLCLTASVALAEMMVDPTRPPAAFDRTQDVAASRAAPVLQSVLIGSGRSEAIINGQTVKLGEKFGDARVIRITDTEVVLQTGKDLQTLRLFPSIEKRPTYSHAGTKHGGQVQEK